MKIKIVTRTDVGKERDNNEDAYLFCSDLTRQDWQQTVTPSYIPLGKYGALVAVADGMGGANAAEEAYLHPDSNLITRALGDDSCNNEPDVISSRLEPGELLLLCSDGLCGYCPDESIEQVLRAHYTDAEQCCDQLLSLALDAGGYDNICIAVVSLIGDDQDAPVAISPVRRFWYAVREVLHI